MAVIVLHEVVRDKHLKEDETIVIEVMKKADLSGVFGTLKGKNMSGQKFKDLARKGWK